LIFVFCRRLMFSLRYAEAGHCYLAELFRLSFISRCRRLLRRGIFAFQIRFRR
jgi:hypothetical protein